MKNTGTKNFNEVCLNMAVFYDRKGWHLLILNEILPFMKKSKSDFNYFLSLSKNNGDHINLFFLVSELKAKPLLLEAYKSFNSFVLENQISNNKTLVPKDGIFCDFEPNSVHYGINDDYLYSSSNEFHFQKELSKLLIYTFEEYGEETITSLTEIMIEFFAMFNQYAGFKDIVIITLFEKLLETEYQKYNDKALKKLQLLNKRNFEENREQITFFLKNSKYESEELEKFQKQWLFIIGNYHKWLNNEQENIEEYLITALSDIFDCEDRVTAYYLFVNALK